MAGGGDALPHYRAGEAGEAGAYPGATAKLCLMGWRGGGGASPTIGRVRRGGGGASPWNFH